MTTRLCIRFSASVRLLLTVFVAVASALSAVEPALAQSTEYELQESGEWKAVRTPEPGSDEAVIAEARRHLAESRPGRAKGLLDDWINKNELGESPWLPAAYLLRGEARAAQGNEWKALFDYEMVIRRFPQSEEFPAAIEREMEIGLRYTKGLKRKLWGMRFVPARDDGVELLIQAQERLPGSGLAERAAIELADYYFDQRSMKLAHEAYDLYLMNYPRGPNRMKAMERRIITNIARFKGPENDASTLIDAKEQTQVFARVYPAEAEARGLDETLVARIDESTAAQMLHVAEWYLDRGDWPSAKFSMQRLVRKHPRTRAASRALQIMADRGWLQESIPPIGGEQPAPQPAPEPADDAQEAPPQEEAAPAPPEGP